MKIYKIFVIRLLKNDSFANKKEHSALKSNGAES
jgi:hypothetical protein